VGSKEFFDQVASQWDQMRTGYFSEAVREKAMDIAGVEAGRKAADLGAGTGFITEGLLRRGLQVIAVDQSEEMLAEMKRKFTAAGVDYRIGEAERLPIADAEVDYAFANMYLHWRLAGGDRRRRTSVRVPAPGTP
jgi:ubiquinone/menaquinone biosynthesis C-methylase UbiE